MNACAGLALALAALLSACGETDTPVEAGDGSAPVAADAAGVTDDTAPAMDATTASPSTAGADAAASGELLMPPAWMPADWDRNAYRGADVGQQPELVHELRQQVLYTAPLTLWAIANDTLIDERFEPVWVWWTALRSCERGIRMSEDLAGEFGDRARGKAALTAAREELKAFAATQPADITLHFTAHLGQWNESTGDFPMQNLGPATTLDALAVERNTGNISPDGATVQLYTDRNGQFLTHVQASISDVSCVAPDRKSVYRFSRQSQWFVVFGDVDRGMGGLANYTARAPLPSFGMGREQAAAFVQRNPERKVVVSITFGASGPGFVLGSDHSAVRGQLRRIVVADAIDGSTLAQRTY